MGRRGEMLVNALAFTTVATVVVNAIEEHTHLLQRQTQAACQYDRDCVDNAYCWNQQTCLCMEGFLVDRNRTHVQCLRISTVIGDPCSMDVQCRVTFGAQAECREGACQCSIGSHFQDERCFESKRIGEICQVSHNCYVEDTPSYCVSGFCTCPFQHHRNEDGSRCIRSSFLGDQCSGDEECVSRNSRCLDVCRCRVDHVISGDRKRCLKAANTVGEPCEEDSQCQEFLSHAECSNGYCSCVKEHHQRGPVCLRSVMLNQACDDHRQCVTSTNKNSNSSDVTNVECVDGGCICSPDYIMTEDLLDCIRYSDSGAAEWKIGWIPLIVLLSQIYKL